MVRGFLFSGCEGGCGGSRAEEQDTGLDDVEDVDDNDDEDDDDDDDDEEEEEEDADEKKESRVSYDKSGLKGGGGCRTVYPCVAASCTSEADTTLLAADALSNLLLSESRLKRACSSLLGGRCCVARKTGVCVVDLSSSSFFLFLTLRSVVFLVGVEAAAGTKSPPLAELAPAVEDGFDRFQSSSSTLSSTSSSVGVGGQDSLGGFSFMAGLATKSSW